MRKIYPTDLSEEEWDCPKARLPVSKLPGWLRTHSLRDIFDAIFYLLTAVLQLVSLSALQFVSLRDAPPGRLYLLLRVFL